MLWAAAVLALASAPPPTAAASARPSPAPSEAPVVIEEIEETTVGDLDGHRVPMGNVTHGTYTLPDGTERTGPICSLVLPGRSPGVFVGKGSVVTVGDHRWTVLKVDSPASGLGSVRLQRLD